ncbi:Uncharacterised protein [Citrobacter koseri]|uniref:Uncharacterized protein n=1 Tax=Citrobacter koseri TaxID=545 RepID=A0A3S4IG30_CITKO|nr:Uncharacterised protein [Citrobacter koseri]
MLRLSGFNAGRRFQVRYFCTLSGQKAQSGILNSIISDALASVANKSGTVSGTASPSESDKVITTGEEGEEESRTNNIPNLIDDDMHQTSSHKNITPVPEPINNASIGYDTNQTGDMLPRMLPVRLRCFRHLIIMIRSHPMNEQVMTLSRMSRYQPQNFLAWLDQMSALVHLLLKRRLKLLLLKSFR